nr:uncharacterized protein LOC118039153 [Populus alba]
MQRSSKSSRVTEELFKNAITDTDQQELPTYDPLSHMERRKSLVSDLLSMQSMSSLSFLFSVPSSSGSSPTPQVAGWLSSWPKEEKKRRALQTIFQRARIGAWCRRQLWRKVVSRQITLKQIHRTPGLRS